MNMELWNKVKKRFEEHPECVNMELYSDNKELSCMTVGCIAGWSVFESGERSVDDIPEVARELLGITEDQMYKLFHLDGWPDELQNFYDSGDHARAVLAAMNAFERGEF
jgi:hypothetical protein